MHPGAAPPAREGRQGSRQGDRSWPGVQGPARGPGWLARGSGAGQGDRGPARGSGAGHGASMVLGREMIEMKIYCLGIFCESPTQAWDQCTVF